jgi:hypothetical protein
MCKEVVALEVDSRPKTYIAREEWFTFVLQNCKNGKVWLIFEK